MSLFRAPQLNLRCEILDSLVIFKESSGHPNDSNSIDAFSVWKPVPNLASGLHPIGDIFMPLETKPGAAILAKAVNENEDTFRHPLFYHRIHTSEERFNNLFWWPECPINFVALGMVANTVYPEPGEFFCVNADLCDIARVSDSWGLFCKN